MAHLLTLTTANGACGVAWLIPTGVPAPETMVAWTALRCQQRQYTFDHEVGHLLVHTKVSG